MQNITEINEPIYARAKLDRDKIGIPLRNQERNIKIKTGKEIETICKSHKEGIIHVHP